jgi:hypothetical protein|tara:strand:- start:290 stop:520 length:231 start_codon:yes stop_codon:yes gene_type:complete
MKYTAKGGMYQFEYDLAVLNEMQDQVREASGKANKDGKSMMERVKQRRHKAGQELSGNEVVELLKQRGIPVVNTGE